MLIIEKNKLYEKIIGLENLFIVLIHITLELFLIAILMAFYDCSYEDSITTKTVVVISIFITSLLFLLLSMKKLNKAFNSFKEIYRKEEFKKISEEIIILEKRGDLGIINKKLLNDLVRFKEKQKKELKEYKKIAMAFKIEKKNGIDNQIENI